MGSRFPDNRMPPEPRVRPGLPELTPPDMRTGLASDPFRKRATALRDRWCRLLSERFDDTLQQTHRSGLDSPPSLDGCTPAEPVGGFVLRRAVAAPSDRDQFRRG